MWWFEVFCEQSMRMKVKEIRDSRRGDRNAKKSRARGKSLKIKPKTAFSLLYTRHEVDATPVSTAGDCEPLFTPEKARAACVV